MMILALIPFSYLDWVDVVLTLRSIPSFLTASLENKINTKYGLDVNVNSVQ